MRRARLALALAALVPVASAPLRPAIAQEAAAYEQAPSTALDRLFPEALIRSGQHRVIDAVPEDDQHVRFTIESDVTGALEAVSIPLAVIRIHEMQTLAQAMNQFAQDNEQLAEEVRGQIRVGGDSFVDILGSPLSTGSEVVSQFGSNVGKTFEEIGEFPGPADRRPGEKVSVGSGDPVFDSHRRNIASQLALDPYSSNPAVQRFLDTMSRARIGGQARAGITTVSIARRPEVQVDGGRVRERIRSAVLNDEQSRLFERNSGLLADAGVPGPLAERLLEHPLLTPTHKSAVTEYVAFLDGVGNRGALVEAAIDSESEVEALGKIQIARMYAHYHETRAALKTLISAGHLALALSTEGALLVALPFDTLYWTGSSDRVFSALADFADRKGTRARRVLLLGVASERARAALEARGFEVLDRFLFAS